MENTIRREQEKKVECERTMKREKSEEKKYPNKWKYLIRHSSMNSIQFARKEMSFHNRDLSEDFP